MQSLGHRHCIVFSDLYLESQREAESEERLAPTTMFFSVPRSPILVKIFIKYNVTIQRVQYILKSNKAFTTGIYKLFKLKEALGITQCEVFYNKSVGYCSSGSIIN